MTSDYLELMAVLPPECLNEIQSSLLDTESVSLFCRREIQSALGLVSEEKHGGSQKINKK
jgi:hypothetical protein